MENIRVVLKLLQSRCADGFNDQLHELVLLRLVENIWVVLQLLQNERLRGWERDRKPICKRGDEASDPASVPGPSEKEEIGSESIFGSVQFRNSVRYRRLARSSRAVEPTNGFAVLNTPRDLWDNRLASA